jgi:hypothetical protein
MFYLLIGIVIAFRLMTRSVSVSLKIAAGRKSVLTPLLSAGKGYSRRCSLEHIKLTARERRLAILQSFNPNCLYGARYRLQNAVYI